VDIIIGALISIIGTMVFNVWISSREESKRWDADRLKALTNARIDLLRALGNIEAMAAKQIRVISAGARPLIIDKAVDEAWYSLEELSVLFPVVENDIQDLQQLMIKRLDFAFTCLKRKDSHAFFKANLEPSEESILEIQQRVLRRCQESVGIN